MTRGAAEIDRRLGAMLQVGAVTAVDNARAAVRVQIGDLLTPWIKVAQIASGTMKLHFMPSVGEQVGVVAPSGEIAHGFVIGSVPTDAAAIAPGADAPTMDLGGGTLRVIGNLWVDGDIHATGQITAGPISLRGHRHGGVAVGGAQTGLPA